MRRMLSALTLAAFVSSAAAQGVPQFDATPGCRAGANSGVAMRKDVDSCVKSESDARAQIVRQWNGFPAGDRTACTSQTRAGGPPSYIELLTCLEMARDARALAKGDNTGLSLGQRSSPGRP
jgi:hypothetical protein